MKIKIIDDWEVELTNDRGDTLTLKGEWYADFFKEYENKQLTIPDVVGQNEQLVCEYCNEDAKPTCCDTCLEGMVNAMQQAN